MCSSIITHVIRDLCGCASGFRVVYDVTKPVGSRVTSVSVRCQNCTYPYYEDLHEDRMYNVLINNYMFGGGDGYDLFKNNVDEFLDYGKLPSWVKLQGEFDGGVGASLWHTKNGSNFYFAKLQLPLHQLDNVCLSVVAFGTH